jgi:large subunit ribosomal protein L13
MAINQTYSAKANDFQSAWLLVDGSDRTVGRLAAAIAHRLRGKHKPSWSPHLDCGDYIIVVNAEKVRFTGQKERQKLYHRHTGYPGGIRTRTAKELRERHPDRILLNAVRGMLPKGPLGRKMLHKLNVYRGPSHPHGSQQPISAKL